MKEYLGIKDCVLRYVELTGVTKKEAERRLKDFLKIVEEGLLDDTKEGIQFVDFLTLRRVNRKAKVGRNPKNTKDTYIIPESKGIKAELGKRFRKLLNTKK